MRQALSTLDPLWEELFPIEQARIVQQLIARIDLTASEIKIHFMDSGMPEVLGGVATAAPDRKTEAAA